MAALPIAVTPSPSLTKQEAKWPFIVNLSNSIIGVSILTMPFCMKQCGVLLGILLLFASNILTRISCHLLMKGAHFARRRSYEHYALSMLGSRGKASVELIMIFFILSTLCAFFVVIGDLGPHVVADVLRIESVSPQLRVFVMCLIAVWIVLPLSLLRNIDSLSHISSMAILFYGVFVFRMALAVLPRLLNWNWIDKVVWWQPNGVFQCMPIFALGLSCQTQLFVLSDCMVEPTPMKMDAVVAGAVNLCSAVYVTLLVRSLKVGVFGYVAFYDLPISGDVMILLESSAVTQLLKMGFLLSVAVSFPLMLFPCREAIYNMLFRPVHVQSQEIVIEIIPDVPFKAITVTLLTTNLIVAILIPNIEFVLGITGSSIGSMICIILPAVLFLRVAPEHHFYSRIAAQVTLAAGVFILVAGTFATLSATHASAELAVVKSPAVVALTTSATAKEHLPAEKMAVGAANGDRQERKEPVLPLELEQKDNHAQPPAPVAGEAGNLKRSDAENDGKKDRSAAAADKRDKRDAIVEAKDVVKELKNQNLEQKKLILEQREIIDDLKQHREEDKGRSENEQGLEKQREKEPLPVNAILSEQANVTQNRKNLAAGGKEV